MAQQIPEPPEPDGGQDHDGHEIFPSSFMARSLVLPDGPWDANEAVRRAQADFFNEPGYCLQQTRGWAGIDALYNTASIAAANVIDMHRDRDFPPGSFLWWTGGASGFGHVAMGEPQLTARSTDAGGTGRIASQPLEWFDQNWPSLNYVGWSDNCNGYRVPGVMKEWDEMATKEELRALLREELRDQQFIEKVVDGVWRREFRATNANGVEVKKHAREFVTGSWEGLKTILKGGE